MSCPECSAANFLEFDILCPTCADKMKQDGEADNHEKYIVLRAGDFIEDAEGIFEDLSDAEDKAVACSIDDRAWLVCDGEGEVLSIAYGRELYNK